MKNGIIVTLLFAFISSPSFCQSAEVSAIDKFAQFPGGVEKFYQYVKNSIQYPLDALKDSIQGDVFVEFTLDETGAIIKDSIKVVEGLSTSCDKEAIRLIMNAPRWIPAKSK